MIVDPDFPDHWKTRLLVDSLDGDEAAPVYVIRLWAHCQNRRTNVFQNLTSAALKALCRYPGHSNKLEAGLASSGFVRREAGDLIVHEWDRYNASLIASWANGAKGGRPHKPTEKTHGLPMANPSETDKRREEENISPPPSVRAGPGGDDTPEELLTLAQAVEQARNAGVAEDYARYIFPDWESRGGRDAGGVKVRWAAYAKKRWNRERPEWEAGTHNGKRKTHGNNSGRSHDRTARTVPPESGELRGRVLRP